MYTHTDTHTHTHTHTYTHTDTQEASSGLITVMVRTFLFVYTGIYSTGNTNTIKLTFGIVRVNTKESTH